MNFPVALTAVPTQEEALFFDPSAELIDLHRTRICQSFPVSTSLLSLTSVRQITSATSITLGPDSITLLRVSSTLPSLLFSSPNASLILFSSYLQSNTRLILGPQGGSTIVQDTRRLNDLRDLSVTDDNGTRVLRLRFKTGDPLDLVTDGELYPLFSSILSDSDVTSHFFRPTSARNGEF